MRKILASVLAIFFCAGSAQSVVSRFLDVAPGSAEAEFLKNPDGFNTRTGGLIASGITSNFLPLYQGELDNVISLAKEEMPVEAVSTKLKAQFLFGFMHSNVLKQYRDSATTLDLVLRGGKYNCLSSTLTYSILLDAFGISNRGVVLPGHIYSRVTGDGADFDVENTSPNGFDVGSNPRAQAELKRRTGMEYAEVNDRIEVVGKRGIFAYTFANSAYFASQIRQPASAFRNALLAVMVFPEGKFIATNLIAAYSGWAISLCDYQREYEKALGLLDEGLSNYPADVAMKTNTVYVLSKFIDSKVAEGKYQDAFDAYDRWKRLTGENRGIALSLYSQTLFDLADRKGDFEGAYFYAKRAIAAFPDAKEVKGACANALNRLVKSLIAHAVDYPKGEDVFLKWYGLTADRNFDILLENYYSDTAIGIWQKGDALRGLNVMRKGLSHLTNSSAMRGNAVYIAGGEANAKFNAKDWKGGLEWCKKALEFEPGNSSVLDNMKTVYRVLASEAIEAKEWKVAMQNVNEGLKLFPGDEKLEYYKKYIEKKIAGK